MKRLFRLLRTSLAILALFLPACSRSAWTAQRREDAFYACRESVPSHAVCQCFARALEHYAPDARRAPTDDEVASSIRVCVPPPPPEPEPLKA